MSGANHPEGEPVSHTFMELKDTARVNRACERWTLLDMARNLARTRRGNASPSHPARPQGTGRAWWEP